MSQSQPGCRVSGNWDNLGCQLLSHLCLSVVCLPLFSQHWSLTPSQLSLSPSAQTLDEPLVQAPKLQVTIFLVLLIQISQGDSLIGLAFLQMRSQKLMTCPEWPTLAGTSPVPVTCYLVALKSAAYCTGARNEADSLGERLVVEEGWGTGPVNYF